MHKQCCPRKYGGQRKHCQHPTALLIYSRHHCKRGINEAPLRSCLRCENDATHRRQPDCRYDARKAESRQ